MKNRAIAPSRKRAAGRIISASTICRQREAKQQDHTDDTPRQIPADKQTDAVPQRPAKKNIEKSCQHVAKIRISRAQKQILFAFCRGEVSKTKSKITNKPSAKANFYLHFAEAKYLRRSQRLRISRVQKQIFICILPRRSI